MKNFLFALILCSSLASAFEGQIPNFKKKSRERGPSISLGYSSIDSAPVTISSGQGMTVESCTSRKNDISLSFFGSLSDSDDGHGISLNSFDPDTNNLKIDIPSYISSCVSLKPNISKVFNYGNKQFARIVFRNVKDMSGYSGFSMEEKIEDCLVKEGYLSDESGQVTWTEKVYDSVTEPKTLSTSLVGKDIDNSKQLGIVFGSPVKTDYNKSPRITENSQCYHDEGLDSDLSYLRDEKTAMDNRIVNLCESLSLDDIQQELESQAKLEPYQRNLLSNVLRQAQENYVDEKLKVLDSLGKEIIESENYDLIQELGLDYLAHLHSLEKEIIEPAKEELIALGSSLSKAKTTDEKRQINQEMNKLSALIGAVSNTSNSRVLPMVLDKLLEYGLSDTANEVALVSIKSNEYAKAKRYIDSKSSRIKSRSTRKVFASIEKVINSEHRKFKNRSKESRIIYEQRTGLSRLSPQVKSDLDRLVRIRDQRFDLAVRNIQRELAKCQKNFLGIMTAPISCKNAMANQAEWYREALSEKERYNKQISKLASKYSFYSNLEKQAQSNLSSSVDGAEEGYNHESNNFLGTYGLYGNDGKVKGNNSDLHRIENRDLNIGNFKMGSDPTYSNYFSSPSRQYPYTSFGKQPQAPSGYNFRR